MTTLNASAVKQSLVWRWPEAISTLGGIPLEILDGKHHPCPKCGGKDRFRYFSDGSGGAFCNQCFSSENADGIATLRWLTGKSFPDAVQALADFAGIGNGNGHSNGNGNLAGGFKAADKKPLKTFATAQEVVTDLERRKGKRSALWTYHNAQGEPVGLVLRWNKEDGEKRDIQPVSLVDAKWANCGMPTPRPLYCLPEIIDAQRVYVCEGEKAADAARSIGLTATTTPHGNQSPSKGDWKPLAGKEVVILPDNDDAGRKYAEAVTAILAKLTPAPVVKVVELPGLSIKDDMVEWIEAHGDAAEPEAMRAEIESMVAAAADSTEEKLPAFAKLIDSATLAAWDVQPEFLVNNILVKGQGTTLGGRSKTLKTGLAIDLAISLGSGTPFLGQFSAKQCNVAVWSGESGIPAIRNTALRAAAAHGVSLPDCTIHWAFDLPRLSRDIDLDEIRRIIEARKIEVVIFDPLYLCLLDGKQAQGAGNVYFMGSILIGLSQLAQQTGVTPIIVHHFKKTQADENEPCTLEDLSQAGVAEWTRAWLLLARAEPYQHDGIHKLFMRSGGSAGFGGLYSVIVDEGMIDGTDFANGRKWETSVTPAGDFRGEMKRQQEQRKAERLEALESEHRQRLLVVLQNHPRGETARALSQESGLNTANFGKAITSLLKEGRAEECEVNKTRGKYEGYRPKV